MGTGRLALLALMTLLALPLVGCAQKKLMLQESFVPGHDKVVRESLKVVGSVGTKDNKTTLTNLYIQVCDVSGGEASGCKTTLVLENITNYDVMPAQGAVR